MFYTIIGTQWGDEGKGKIVDWFSSKAHAVVRFQGGNNAGHTIKIKEKEFKLNLLPSGIIRGKTCIIGNGVILDPLALRDEISKLVDLGIEINPKNLQIAENICLILPLHKDLDGINEESRGKENIGTTKKGIGPAYEDKIGRRSIRLCDLSDKNLLMKKIENLSSFHSLKLNHYGKNFDKEELLNQLMSVYDDIGKFTFPIWQTINDLGKKNKTILFEGAQGALLDIDFGTYPYVTSSNTSSGQIFAGTGFGIKNNHRVFGITKAYTTRVGSGPFPTELIDKIGEYFVVKGKEFGTVTKRKRRCGWFDANLVKQIVKISGVDNIILTKLDVLDDLDEIKVCIAYNINGTRYEYLPFNENLQKNVEPIYENIKGWKQNTFGVTSWNDLPKNAQNYINFLEKIIDVEIPIISTGPERNQTIDRKKILNNI